MTKEEIIEILAKAGDNSYIPWSVKCNIADEILALHRSEFPMSELVDTGIDAPTDEEIRKEQSIYPTVYEERAFYTGQKWMKDEIIKRNK